MMMPLSSELFSGCIRWPVFLLANEVLFLHFALSLNYAFFLNKPYVIVMPSCQFSTALSIARDFVGRDEDLARKITKDSLMKCAVKECYDSLKYVLEIVVVGELEKR